jgi:hypothetical protein
VGCTGAESIPTDDTNAHVNSRSDLTAAYGKTDVETDVKPNVAAINYPTDAYTHCHIGHPGDIDRHDHRNPEYTDCHRDPDVAINKLDHRNTYRHRSPRGGYVSSSSNNRRGCTRDLHTQADCFRKRDNIYPTLSHRACAGRTIVVLGEFLHTPVHRNRSRTHRRDFAARVEAA